VICFAFLEVGLIGQVVWVSFAFDFDMSFNGRAHVAVYAPIPKVAPAVGDLSGFYATSAGNGAFAGAFLTYLLGPRVNFRHGKLAPFVQALFGGVRTTDGIAYSTGTENNFAMTAGGGIDIKVSRHILVRPIQAEYFMTKIPDGLNNRQDNLRIGAGIGLRLGR
jgi:opacity protein-like surface antigen